MKRFCKRPGCDNDFTVTSKRTLYCSKECYTSHQNRKNISVEVIKKIQIEFLKGGDNRTQTLAKKFGVAEYAVDKALNLLFKGKKLSYNTRKELKI